jgi:hypothetical protein
MDCGVFDEAPILSVGRKNKVLVMGVYRSVNPICMQNGPPIAFVVAAAEPSAIQERLRLTGKSTAIALQRLPLRTRDGSSSLAKSHRNWVFVAEGMQSHDPKLILPKAVPAHTL